jgi:hypothetical protein
MKLFDVNYIAIFLTKIGINEARFSNGNLVPYTYTHGMEPKFHNYAYLSSSGGVKLTPTNVTMLNNSLFLCSFSPMSQKGATFLLMKQLATQSEKSKTKRSTNLFFGIATIFKYFSSILKCLPTAEIGENCYFNISKILINPINFQKPSFIISSGDQIDASKLVILSKEFNTFLNNIKEFYRKLKQTLEKIKHLSPDTNFRKLQIFFNKFRAKLPQNQLLIALLVTSTIFCTSCFGLLWYVVKKRYCNSFRRYDPPVRTTTNHHTQFEDIPLRPRHEVFSQYFLFSVSQIHLL